jgi:hypothetical protein
MDFARCVQRWFSEPHTDTHSDADADPHANTYADSGTRRLAVQSL